MSPQPVAIQLTGAQCAEADLVAKTIVDMLLAAGNPLTYHNAQNRTVAQCLTQHIAGARAEFAAHRYLPMLHWHKFHKGKPAELARSPDLGDFVDVKGSENPYAKYLISPETRDLVDSFAYVFATPLTHHMTGWVLHGWEWGKRLRNAPLLQFAAGREPCHAIYGKALYDMADLRALASRRPSTTQTAATTTSAPAR